MTDFTQDKKQGSVMFVLLASLVATLGGLLFGYDTGVISGAIGPLVTHFSLSPEMKGWAASCALIGCIFGAAFAGAASDALGRKKVLIISAFLFLTSAIGTAVPPNLTLFVIFRFIGGLGVGAASMTSPMYIAEISPARIRGRMVSLNQFAIVFGFLVVYFVNYFIAQGRTEEWIAETGWRWMFGSESIPAVILLVLAFIVPESPRWLTKKNREDEAMGVLTRVNGPDHAASEMAAIKESLSLESESIGQLLHPGMIIILVIGVVLAVLQQVTGINVVLYYAPELFKNIGFDTESALLQTIIVGIVNISFTFVAIWTVDKIGRKPLMLLGSAGMGLSLLVLGLAFHLHLKGIWLLVCMLFYIASFASSMGPVVWVILSEIFPTKIRGRAMAISTVALWIACYVVSQTFPMLDGNKYLVEKFNHGFSFWIYALFCLVTILFVWRFVPETKGKSLEEIEKMWMKE